MKNTETGPFHLFLIEDNQADIDLLSILLTGSKPEVKLHACKDGVDAADFLFRRGSHADAEIAPDLILMDLNFPKKDAFELMKEIKADPDLCKIPIIALSNSSNERDVDVSYCLGASAFLNKPTSLDDFQVALRRMIDFYFGSCRLATRTGLA